VKIGVVFSQADSGTDPLAIRRFARTAEAAGFDHLMAYDHVLGASPERLGPGPFGSFPSAPYTSEHVFHEILVLFSHLAAVTERLRFVTSVLLGISAARVAQVMSRGAWPVVLVAGSLLPLVVWGMGRTLMMMVPALLPSSVVAGMFTWTLVVLVASGP